MRLRASAQPHTMGRKKILKPLAGPPLRQKSIISTPKIDFRADFRPTSAGNFTCFTLLKIRRPLRHPTKMAQKKGLG